MKTLLELYYQSLNETTYDIDADVDLVYKMCGMKKFLEEFAKNDYTRIPKYTKKTFDSSVLKCPQSVASHKVNPITISGELGTGDNFYDMAGHRIQLSIPKNVVDLYQEQYPLFYDLDGESQRMIKSELNESRRKATIYHELSHWISDSLHNSHITNIVKHVVNEPNRDKAIKLKNLGKYDVGETYYEIDAQIHGIKQIKRSKTDSEWNNMSLDDLFYLYPSLNSIKNKLKRSPNDNELYNWIRALITRMNREGLLGKNMTDFPS